MKLNLRIANRGLGLAIPAREGGAPLKLRGGLGDRQGVGAIPAREGGAPLKRAPKGSKKKGAPRSLPARAGLR